MKTTKRFLLTLAAMIGMTGAWAQATDEEVAVTKSANNEWTLTMPESNVWVVATYTKNVQDAKEVQGNADATQAEVSDALSAITDAKTETTVEVSRITIVIPAKSYVARIDAENRKIETAVAGVSLYTVNNVTDSQVVLSDVLNVVAAAMPYLIYNDNDEEMAAADYYVLSNGQDFVWVKDAGMLAAGKCWIELPASPAHARRLAIVHEGTTTCIAGVSGKTADHSDWYDLSGRRVMQSTKGLYIIGSRKVVVK